MKYINARTVLPEALVAELQGYVQGVCLYVPTKEEQRKAWGEVSGYRRELQQRNREIMQGYNDGISIETLAEKYCLSVHGIRKIIYQK